MAPKNRYNFGLSPLLKRGTAARERMLESTGGIPEVDYENAMKRAEELGMKALSQPDVLEPFENILNPEDIKKRLAEKKKPALPTDIEVQEPVPETSEITPELAARVKREGTVRFEPTMARANLLPQETTSEADVVAAQFPTPSLLGGQELSLGGGQAEEVPVPLPAEPVAPSAAPGTLAAPGAQPTRLEQLAKIISMTGGAEMAPEDKRRAALVDAIGKAQQAMYAGVTRSALPPTFFQQAATEQTPMNRLEQLYKASQILGQPKATELASDAAKQFLTKNAPELLEGVDINTLTSKDADRLMNLHAGTLKGKERKLLQDERLSQARELAGQRLDLAKRAMDQREFTYVTNKITSGAKEAQSAVLALPVLEELFNKDLSMSLQDGADLMRKAGAGLLNESEQRNFDILYERIIAEDRKRIFGATLTKNEQESFNRIAGLGTTAAMSDKLKALRILMKGMQRQLQAAFVPIQDKDAFLKFEAQSGISHRNPIFSAFDEQLQQQIEAMPTEASDVMGVGAQNIFKRAGNFLGDLLGPSAPAATTLPVQAPVPPAQAAPTQTTPPPPPQSNKFKKARVDNEDGWIDTETDTFYTDDEMKAMQADQSSKAGR